MGNLIIYGAVAIGSYGAYRLKALSKSGALAAFLLGASIVIGLGWEGLLLIGLFFSSSSLFSSYKKRIKQSIDKKLANGSRRNWAQVAANGGPAGISSLFYFISDGSDIWLIAFIVSIAAATSDTWSSELGVLSKSDPMHIISLKRCERGTSGAVSVHGTLAGLFGSIFIAVIAGILFNLSFSTILLLSAFGFLGSILDTLLGAFLQVEYICPVCSVHTEKKVHCNTRTVKRKGINWINNETVNLSSILISTIFCIITWYSIT
ncbi:DUF92 domain-containing protein [Bacillus sp. E214]|uniref:DUF92 domain-containing protein n=1 Tax=Bacillus sp. E214 TaxID=2587156 RepID=UPI0011DF742E|nr:DUF92 domain-containing protein [Bacillus sp. E214]